MPILGRHEPPSARAAASSARIAPCRCAARAARIRAPPLAPRNGGSRAAGVRRFRVHKRIAAAGAAAARLSQRAAAPRGARRRRHHVVRRAHAGVGACARALVAAGVDATPRRRAPHCFPAKRFPASARRDAPDARRGHQRTDARRCGAADAAAAAAGRAGARHKLAPQTHATVRKKTRKHAWARGLFFFPQILSPFFLFALQA
jgi:hypothetical protein